jgi:hypothetical protein
LKKPGWPWTRARVAAIALRTELMSKANGKALASPSPAGHSIEKAQMVSQNSRSRCTRSPSGEPAMMAALRAPIEMPANQFGRMPASCRPS